MEVVDPTLKAFTGTLITVPHRNDQQFGGYWQVIANLIPNKLTRWFDECRFELILKPTVKDEHPNNFEVSDTQLSSKLQTLSLFSLLTLSCYSSFLFNVSFGLKDNTPTACGPTVC